MKRVKSIPGLMQVSKRCRCVVVGRGIRMPAAFVLSMQARIVQRFIDRGMFIYKPKNKSTK